MRSLPLISVSFLLFFLTAPVFAAVPHLVLSNYQDAFIFKKMDAVLIHEGDDPSYRQPEFDDSGWKVTHLPSVAQKTVSNWGSVGWYRLHIVMPDSLPDRDYAIELGRIYTADETYLNGVLIASNGAFGNPVIHAYGIMRIYVLPRSLIKPGADNVIAIRVSGSFDGKSGPINGSFRLMPYNDFMKAEYRIGILIIIIIVANLVIGLYFLLFFIRSPQEKDYLVFSITILLVACYSYFRSDLRFAIPLDFNTLKKIEYLFYFPIAAMFTLYIQIYFRQKNTLFHSLFYGLSALSVLFVVFTKDPQWWSWLNKDFLQYVYIIAIVSVFWTLIRKFKTSWDARAMLGAFGILTFTVFNDILVSRNILFAYLLPYGSFFMILANALILANRFNQYSENLELKVEERTREVEDRTRKLDQANRRLQNLDKLKNDFIANISHDFRSPLTVILNISDLALQFNPQLDGKVKEDFQIISKASFRLKNSIDKLLDLAKIDAQGIRLNITPVDLVSFLDNILDFYRSSLMKSGIRITRVFPGQSPANFYSDQEKLEEIIDNLLSNSVKFVDMKTGAIQVKLEDEPDFVRITISDNGIGIPEEKLESIFNRFEQAGNSKGSVFKGTGIGLAFSRQLTLYLKGQIHAESAGEGKGSSFILELKKGRGVFGEEDFRHPSEKGVNRRNLKTMLEIDIEDKLEEKGVASSIVELNREDEYEATKALILIIDDDRNIRNIVVRYLKKKGYINFLTATDGKEALNAVYQFQPDIIISDINMPNMRGDEFQDELLENPRYSRIPFIFLSAVADRDLIEERREKGACAYLQKPIDEKELTLTVHQALETFYSYLKFFNLATIDQLSGLYNRREVMHRFEQELSARVYRELSVILFDIDDFKRINDEYGHQCGDKVIAHIGAQVREKMRKGDICGRYGGDEFFLVLPNTNLAQAVTAADELRAKIAEKGLEYGGKTVRVTTSSGISSLVDNAARIEDALELPSLIELYSTSNGPKTDWDYIEAVKKRIGLLLFQLADESLYQAKNRFCGACGHTTPDKTVFSEGVCPKCDSRNIKAGKNRVTAFLQTAARAAV